MTELLVTTHTHTQTDKSIMIIVTMMNCVMKIPLACSLVAVVGQERKVDYKFFVCLVVASKM